jgi:SAM-dependent methyltransferase
MNIVYIQWVAEAPLPASITWISLPFDNHTFTKALAIHSMHVWPDAMASLRDMRRVMTPGGRIALGFTSYAGQSKDGLPEMLTAAGFTEAHVVEAEAGFYALAITPSSTMTGACHLTGGSSGSAGK